MANDSTDRPRSTGRRSWIRPALFTSAGAAAILAATLIGPGDSPASTDVVVGETASELVSVALPLEVNNRVERWITRYLGDQRPAFERYLAREGLFGEMIRTKLRKRGMPEELIYLAMIESGFSPRATSRVKATGVWQFMGPTARQYGLRVDDYVDERRDPLRATDAALDYLESLHRRFDSWYLAAAGYNAGPNRVARILRTYAGDRRGDEELYWEIINHLPRETREYVPKILAAAVLARAADYMGLDVELAEPYSFDRVFVPGGTRLTAVAHSMEVPLSVIADLNPHLIRGVTPPGEAFSLRVPKGRSAIVVAALNNAGSRRSSIAD